MSVDSHDEESEVVTHVQPARRRLVLVSTLVESTRPTVEDVDCPGSEIESVGSKRDDDHSVEGSPSEVNSEEDGGNWCMRHHFQKGHASRGVADAVWGTGFSIVEASTHIWEDDMGTQHEVTQGERGEQGDPLMPMLLCLGQHGALAAVEGRLKAGKIVRLLGQPDRVQDVHRILEEELRTRVGIRVHHGKTQTWNRSGCTQRGVDVMTKIARRTVKDAVLWRGDQYLPVGQQRIRVLGVPIGREEYVKNHGQEV